MAVPVKRLAADEVHRPGCDQARTVTINRAISYDKRFGTPRETEQAPTRDAQVRGKKANRPPVFVPPARSVQRRWCHKSPSLCVAEVTDGAYTRNTLLNHVSNIQAPVLAKNKARDRDLGFARSSAYEYVGGLNRFKLTRGDVSRSKQCRLLQRSSHHNIHQKVPALQPTPTTHQRIRPQRQKESATRHVEPGRSLQPSSDTPRSARRNQTAFLHRGA